jgi:hypothetical protein
MDDEGKDDWDVMASYLAEKICPSQKPTNISHLLQRNPQLSSPSMEVDGQQQQQQQQQLDADENPLGRETRINLSADLYNISLAKNRPF